MAEEHRPTALGHTIDRGPSLRGLLDDRKERTRSLDARYLDTEVGAVGKAMRARRRRNLRCDPEVPQRGVSGRRPAISLLHDLVQPWLLGGSSAAGAAMALSFDPDAAWVAGTCRGPSRAVETGTSARPTTSASSGPALGPRLQQTCLSIVFVYAELRCGISVSNHFAALASSVWQELVGCPQHCCVIPNAFELVGGSASTARVAPVAGAALARPGEAPALSSSQ